MRWHPKHRVASDGFFHAGPRVRYVLAEVPGPGADAKAGALLWAPRGGALISMTRPDWDRETREARKRKRGSIPVWADPATLSLEDERSVLRLIEPMVELTHAFLALSSTHRGQRASEFEYKL